ncbi:MAG: questin oxidase family protein [Acidimicrobiales bacterium]
MDSDPLDDALTIFAGTAPEFGAHGLSNHGPMAAEALVRLGRVDAVGDWAAAYAERLRPAPLPSDKPMADEDWPRALGDAARFPDWLAVFETEMADQPAAAVIREWVPRLVPGAVGAATHGLIRTAHGLRALGEVDTPARRVEVATGLAYWASKYQELPGPPLLIGHQAVPDAVAALPYLPEETSPTFLITDRVAFVSDIADEFEQGVASLAPGGDATALLDALAAAGATSYLRNAEDGHAIALLHAITAPLALELVLPWLAEEDRDAAVAYAWQAVAALHVAYDIERRAPLAGAGEVPTADALVERAVASGDEHAIKLTEAALRSHARSGEPALLLAAADASARFAR